MLNSWMPGPSDAMLQQSARKEENQMKNFREKIGFDSRSGAIDARERVLERNNASCTQVQRENHNE